MAMAVISMIVDMNAFLATAATIYTLPATSGLAAITVTSTYDPATVDRVKLTL